jgi:hypothetical protein
MRTLRTRALPTTIACLLALGAAGIASSCSGLGRSSSQSVEGGGEEVARNEEADLHREEAAEAAQDREDLGVIEGKNREEEAEATAQKTEAEAVTRAKKRVKAAEKAAKRKEKEAKEAVTKQHEAEAKAKQKTSTEQQTTRTTTTRSTSPPPSVEVQSEPN